MKFLPPIILLAGAVGGLMLWPRTKTPSYGAVAPTTVITETATTRFAPSLAAPLSAAPEESLANEITDALRHGSAADRERSLTQSLPRLVATDPAAAGHLALAWAPGTVRDELLRQVIRQWAEQDLGGVITWLTSLLDVPDRALAAGAAVTQVAQTDRAGALDLAQALHVGLDDGSLEHMAQVWTEEEPRAAVSWVTTQPASPVRDRLVARIAWVRAQNDPAEAASLVLNQMSPGAARDEALLGIVRQWAGRDVTGATAWVGNFPSGVLHTRAQAVLSSARLLR